MEANTLDFLGTAAVGARDRLAGLAAQSGMPDERRMASIGAAALFEEALLTALRAQLTELRTVAR